MSHEIALRLGRESRTLGEEPAAPLPGRSATQESTEWDGVNR